MNTCIKHRASHLMAICTEQPN